MKSKFWIKLWHETLHDPKMGSLRDRIWRRAIECFLMAGEVDEGGKLPSIEQMAWILRMEIEELETDLFELQQGDILDFVDGRWFVRNFESRQAPISSTKRSQHYRKRIKRGRYQGELWDEPSNEMLQMCPTEEEEEEEEEEEQMMRQRPFGV